MLKFPEISICFTFNDLLKKPCYWFWFKSFQLGWMIAITTEGEKRLRGVFSVVNFISGVSAVALQSSD